MFDRIVIPLEDPHSGEVLLGALARLLGAEPEVDLLLLRGDATDPLQEAARRHFKPGRVRMLRHPGASAEAIREAAGTREGALIALPARDRRGRSGPSVGGLAERLLQETPAPLLLLREGTLRPPRVLLLPMDGSPEWKASAVCATELARRHEGRVVVLRATPPGERETAEREAHEACGAIVAAGALAHAFVEEDPPTRAILDAAAAHAVDLIVMTSPGEGRPGPRRVIEDVSHAAGASLMIVPAAMAAAWAPAAAALAED